MSSSGAVDWLPPLITLGIGLVAGALLFLRARRSRATSAEDTARALHARDLLARRDALVRQLQELEDTQSKRSASQLARERQDLELETARVLLALDAAAATPEPTSDRKRAARPSASAVADRRAGMRGFLWGIGSATAVLLVAFFVWQSAKPRQAGGSVTGTTPMSRSGPSAPDDADEARINAALERNPSDVEAHLALADLKLARRDLMGVWNETARILELSPDNPRALTYQAVVRLAMGQPAIAVDLLRKATTAEPNLIDAHAYLALAYVRMGRRQDAEATVAAASRRFPDRADEFRQLLAEHEGDQAAQGAVPAESRPRAAASGGGGAAAGARGGRHVAGTIDLDPALRGKVPPRAVLFVFVREAGVTEGPPVAVKRLAPVFPVSFDLSGDDAMMGQPFPDPLLIEARLDEDGDPTTRPPTDPKARLDGVRAGRTDLKLVLRRP